MLQTAVALKNSLVKFFIKLFRSCCGNFLHSIITKYKKVHNKFVVRQWRRRRRSSVHPLDISKVKRKSFQETFKKLFKHGDKPEKESSVHPPNVSTEKRKSFQETFKKFFKRGGKKLEKEYDITLSIFEQMGIEFAYKSNKYQKITWYFIVLIMTAFSLWQCGDALKRYFEWNVHTQITYETVQDVKYPSISLCNVNSFKKSVIGSNFLLQMFISYLLTADNKKALEMALTSLKYCKKGNETDMDLNQLLQDAVQYTKISDYHKLAKMAGVDSFSSVEKCWWNNREFSCDGAFQNVLFETKLCFTFNFNMALNSFVGGDDTVGYGYNETGAPKANIVTTGSKQGLRLLLNSHQEEYCGIFAQWFGAGFYVFVHDYQRPQSALNHANVALVPGYHTQITLKPTSFDRQTEFLDRCKSSMDLFLMPLNENVYFEESCYAQCFLEMTWRACTCLPTILESVKKLAAKRYKLPLQSIKMCYTVDNMQCMKKMINKAMYETNTNQFCQCKSSCKETVYEYTVSTLAFPSKQLFENFQRYNSTVDYKTFKNNYALATFNFDSMRVEIVTETQQFTIIDLLTYIGGSFGLFLGWSVVSNTGLCLHLLLQVGTVIVKRLKKNNVHNLRKHRRWFCRKTVRSRRPTFAELYL